MNDFANVIARRKLNAPDGWEWYRWEAIGDDGLYTGAVPEILPSGRKKWPKDGTRVVITRAEMDAECADYEKRTGLCSQCQGEKQTVASASVATGTLVRTFRACSRCKGTGSAP